MKQPAEFQKFFDHTLLKPDASREEILKLCRDAAEYDFASGSYVHKGKVL